MATAGEGAAEHLDDGRPAASAEPVCRGVPHYRERSCEIVDGADERREKEHLFAVVEAAERHSTRVEIVAVVYDKARLAIRPDLHREAGNFSRLRLLEVVQHGRLHGLACVGAYGDEGREVGKAGVGRGRNISAQAAAHAERVRRDEPYLLKLLANVLYWVVLRQIAHGVGEGELGVVYRALAQGLRSGMVVAARARKHLLLAGGDLFVEYLRLASRAAHCDGVGQFREVVGGDGDREARGIGRGDPRTRESGGVFVARGHQEKLEGVERKGLRRADIPFNDGNAVVEGERAPFAYLEVLKLETSDHFTMRRCSRRWKPELRLRRRMLRG